jgi:D-alanyl-D-alanine carboxypeptidase
MRLTEQGALSLDDPIDRYLPDDLIHGIDVYQGHDYTHALTIAELLSQTSGLPDYYEDKASDGTSLFEVFMAEPERVWTVDELIARSRDQMTPHFAPGTAAYYSDTNYQLLGKIIESVTGKPLQLVYEQFFFVPLGLQHTWVVGLSQPQVAPSQLVADVFYNDVNITRIRSNGAYWADAGIVSTTSDMIAFLKALNRGEIISKASLESMHHWQPLQNLPFQYGYGTMALPRPVNTALGVRPIWGHTGSDGAFLYYSDDLDLYMAGTIDQTEDNTAPIVLMMRVMKAVQDLDS